MYLKFLISLLEHKWFVLIAGLRVGGIPLYKLIIHDYSKLSREEFGAYARNFYGNCPKEEMDKVKSDFGKALEHHYKENSHHWNFWIRSNVPVAMFEEDIREMVADWFGANRAYVGNWDMSDWLRGNLGKMNLHVNTRSKLYEILKEFGYEIYHEQGKVRVEKRGI